MDCLAKTLDERLETLYADVNLEKRLLAPL
jgi:hypothetical protein